VTNLPDIDRLGALLAHIAELSAQADLIKAQLKELPDGAYEGKLFRVTVSTSTRETLDMAAVRAHLSRQFIQAHTRETETQTVRVVARKGVREDA
jgi:hypothetical protein